MQGSHDIYLDLDRLCVEVMDMNRKALQALQNAVGQAETTVAKLTALGWSGTAADAYLGKFSKYKGQARSLYVHVEEFNQALMRISENGDQVLSSGRKLVSRLW